MKKYSMLIAICLTIIGLVMFFYILYIGAGIIIPFIIAVLLSFAILSLSWFFQKKWIPNVLSFLLSLFTYFLIFWLISWIINSNIQQIMALAPEYQTKLQNIVNSFETTFNIDKWVLYERVFSWIDIPSILTNTVSGVTSIFKNTGIIFFFVIFILLESRFFFDKLDIALWREKTRVMWIIRQIGTDIKYYFVIKTWVSLVVWAVSYIILVAFGVDFALFWAFLIFLLNYIPNIGSIIAVCFPVLFSMVQFGEWTYYITLWLLACLTTVQVLMWNYVEPQFMGNKLNLSPLVILISLLFWGTIWGIPGMLLSVPLMVIINIVLAHIKMTQPLAVVLSEKGNINFVDAIGKKKKGKKMMKDIKKKLKM